MIDLPMSVVRFSRAREEVAALSDDALAVLMSGLLYASVATFEGAPEGLRSDWRRAADSLFTDDEEMHAEVLAGMRRVAPFLGRSEDGQDG